MAPPSISLFGITPVSSTCTADVPFINITFGTRTDLNGRTGSLAFFDLNNILIETRPLTYQAGTTVQILYPGATVDAQGNPTDWPGWMFTGGFWVPDPSDAAWRDGLRLVFTLNGETATANVTYPPETATCSANPPPGPVPSGVTTTTTTLPAGGTTTTLPGAVTTPPVPGAPTPAPGPSVLPTTGSDAGGVAAMAVLIAAAGSALLLITRRRRTA